MTARRLRATAPVVLFLLATLAGCAADAGEDASSSSDRVSIGDVGRHAIDPGPPLIPVGADGTFTVHALGNRCWDFGGQAYWAPGAPVTLYTCNGTVAQQVHVTEIDETHDVILRAQSAYCIGVRAGKIGAGNVLELQTCNGSPSQRFALDGDSIMVGTQREGAVTRDFVIGALNRGTANKTPLALTARDGSDAQYFRMTSIDGSAAQPTRGFVKVSSEQALEQALGLGWGTVVEIDESAPLVLSGATKEIRSGVTVRGYRKLIDNGPLVIFPKDKGTNQHLFDIPPGQSNVRVTGFRLQGTSRSTDSQTEYVGIQVNDTDAAHPMGRVTIDHLEASDFTSAAIAISGDDSAEWPYCPATNAYPRANLVQVIDCFLHHNEMENHGYGVVVGNGGFVNVSGLVAYDNRHSISADPWGTTGYVASDNFVLSDAPSYGFLGWDHEQDFDKHGSDKSNDWKGGISDDYVEVSFNTFLGTNRHNFDERGTPCNFTSVHDNVFLQGKDAAIRSMTGIASRVTTEPNRYDAYNPTNDFAVGDFDGDHLDDAFVATGTGFWFSSGARAEWRFLKRSPEATADLRFGDFDGDGRTDVVALHGSLLDVSWAGASPWQTINVVAASSIQDIAVGDFDGDRVADLFYANGSEWFVAPAGRSWRHFAYSSYRTGSIGFGDFDGDKRTDVFGVVANQWMYVPGNGDSWTPLRTALTTTVNGLVFADFDGDGFTDVLRAVNGAWQYAARGWGGFVTIRSTNDGIAQAHVGHFDGDAVADMLELANRHFYVAFRAKDPLTLVGRQDVQ